jgi:hypothetical protein
MLLFAYPLALAIASIVSDEETEIGPVYSEAGGSPLTRYEIVAPGVESVMVTVCHDV